MKKYPSIFVCVFVLICAATVSAQEQYPVMNMVAGKVIQKYQHATCEQLWAEKGKQKSQKEQEIVQLLRAEPQVRQAFLDKVAAPIVNKMFECGMIP
ncbi:MAG: hypothetical protein AB7U29_14235 [Desulfobulbus sp.]